ncbi:MAG: RidA family protein [Ardenticatenales bacterium]|nr:RidA family protein [Ardenticatenales bacterium]
MPAAPPPDLPRIIDPGVGHHHTVISTDKAPSAIGPYSQAIRVDLTVFCSGQVPIDPATGQLVDGDVSVQTRQALTNLAAVLDAAGSGPDRVLKTTVFLIDMDDFQAMNAVYADFFPSAPPARSTIAVKALPRGARVEIEAIALAKS